MTAITAFLEQRLKLKVNAAKSAVARPWQRKFLGYSMTWHRKPKLKIAQPSRERLAEKIRKTLRARPRTKPETSHRATQPGTAGLDCVLPAHRSKRCAGRPRWLDQAQAADVAVAAMEARLHTGEEPDAGWAAGRTGVAVGHQRTRSVVERWRLAHARRPIPKSWFDRMGLVSLLDTQRRFSSCFMNRRMRNRTSGGVGGRRG